MHFTQWHYIWRVCVCVCVDEGMCEIFDESAQMKNTYKYTQLPMCAGCVRVCVRVCARSKSHQR